MGILSQLIIIAVLNLVLAALVGHGTCAVEKAPLAGMDAPANRIPPGDGAALQRVFKEASTAGWQRLVVPPGVYHLAAIAKNEPHLVLDGVQDLEIAADGVVLVCDGRIQEGVVLRNCRGVTLHGLRLERKVPTCSQGVIERIEDDGAHCVVRIDAGYPNDIDDPRYFPFFWGNVFAADRTRWLAHYRGHDAVRIGADLFRISMHCRPQQVPIPLVSGTPIAWRGVVTSDIKLKECHDCTIARVVVWWRRILLSRTRRRGQYLCRLRRNLPRQSPRCRASTVACLGGRRLPQ